MELEMKKGFKKTEVGLIPNDWNLHKVNDLIDLLTDYDANGSFASVAENVEVYDSDNYAWYVRSTDLEKKSKLSEVRYVDKKSYKFLKKTALYGGELLFLKRGDIGNVYLFQMKTRFATVAPNLYLLKLNSLSNSTYLFNFFKSNLGQRQLKSKNASSTLGALYKDDVKSIYVPLPPTLAEQKAIATALSDVDDLISTLDALIAKKKAIKQGAMQQLLTPPSKGGKRLDGFDGEWVGTILGDVCDIRKGQLITESTRTDGPIPVIAGGKKAAYYHANANRFGKTITISGSGASAGYVAFHNHPIFASDCSTIEESSKYSIEFIYYLLSLMQKQIYNAQTGGAQPHIHPSDLNPMEVGIPKVDEQKAIAQILSDMDKELEELTTKKGKYEHIKQGMMQELLTGKTRLV